MKKQAQLMIAVLMALVSIGFYAQQACALAGVGTVLNSVTGAPVSNAKVVIVDGYAISCSDYTTADGTLSCNFYGVLGEVVVQITKKNYTQANYRIRGPLNTWTLVYENPPKNLIPFGWFEGYVTQPGGLALEGATVSTGTKTTTTDADGHFVSIFSQTI